MAISTQDIQNYLAANPGMTDAQIAAAMDQYGVSASQLAAATGLGEQAVADRYAAQRAADYEGNLYNPDTLRNLYSQIVPNVDLSQLHGGVYNTSGESIGFNYDVGSQVLAPILGGRAPTSTEQLVLDMARYLNNRGITDLSQLTPEMAGRFGETYTGGGGTAYNVSFNPDGTPTFGTTGFSTSDKDKILLALAAGATLFGIPGLTNGLLSSGGAGAAGAEALGSGAWLGEGIASGIPAWDAAALSAGNTLAGVSPALLDAQFIAADAAQLAAQTGNNVAAIQQNLIAAGVDPIVAATAADAAALGVTGSELITTIAGAGESGAGLFTGGSAADLALGGITTTTGAPAGSTVPGGGAPTGGGGTTTTTGGLPPGVTTTLTNLLRNPGNLAGLLGLLGGGGGAPMGVGSIPTQGMPTNSPEYFNQVQGFLNQYLPGQMPTQSQYLSSWYNNTPGSYMPGGGMMNPPAPAPAPVQGGGKGRGRDNRSERDTGSRRPVPAPLPPVSLDDIRTYLGSRPGMTDQEIAAAMTQYGVSPQQMAEATGVPYAEVLQRYLDARQANLTNSILSSMQEETSPINTEALAARGITSPEWLNVSTRDLIEKSGYNVDDKAASDRAFYALYGNVGANMDTRDWAAIMASDNPLAAAEAALARMYSDPNFRAQNAEWLASQGFPEASAPLTYAQMVGRTGASYTPTAAEAAMIAQEINNITSAAGGGYHQAELAGPAQVLANAGYAVDPGYKPYLNQPLQTAQPVNYGGLSAQSSASDIAQAYKQFTGGAAGDTVESRNAAIQYLQNIGIDPSRIGEAYSLFKA